MTRDNEPTPDQADSAAPPPNGWSQEKKDRVLQEVAKYFRSLEQLRESRRKPAGDDTGDVT